MEENTTYYSFDQDGSLVSVDEISEDNVCLVTTRELPEKSRGECAQACDRIPNNLPDGTVIDIAALDPFVFTNIVIKNQKNGFKLLPKEVLAFVKKIEVKWRIFIYPNSENDWLCVRDDHLTYRESAQALNEQGYTMIDSDGDDVGEGDFDEDIIIVSKNPVKQATTSEKTGTIVDAIVFAEDGEYPILLPRVKISTSEIAPKYLLGHEAFNEYDFYFFLTESGDPIITKDENTTLLPAGTLSQ